MSDVTLSAVVISQNSAMTIERCVRSLSFADEVVVVDALSDDGTPEAAQRCGARVVSNAWPGFAAQKQLAIDEARGDWVFLCDTDEVVPEALAREISRTIEHPGATAGYRLRRRNQFLGEWFEIGPWAEDRVLRLFRKRSGRMTEASVHEGVVVDGPVLTLQHPLYHFTHPTIADSFERLNRYTTLEARDRAGRRRIHLVDMFVPPVGVFVKYYLIKGCWRAGVRGFLMAAITAMYKSVLYAKLYYLQRERSA